MYIIDIIYIKQEKTSFLRNIEWYINDFKCRKLIIL